MNTVQSVFGEVIYAYSRAQAHKDGVLIDVSDVAREAGFVYPVSVTSAVMTLIEDIPASKRGWQDVEGRLWDVVYLARFFARFNKDKSQYLYQLTMHHGRKSLLTLKAVCGPGDNMEPVITIMLPEED